MNESRAIRILSGYAVLSSAALIWLAAHALSARTELNVERLNIVDADGRVRLALANNKRLPEPVVNGKKLPANRDASGMIFFNDEGTECGGLIYGGKAKDGKGEAGASLTFDQFNQDQTVALQYIEGGGSRNAGLQITDRPEVPIDQVSERVDLARKLPPAERAAALAKLREEGLLGNERVYMGKGRSRASLLVLSDGKGRPRLTLRVAEGGEAEIVFTDAAGKPVKTIKGI